MKEVFLYMCEECGMCMFGNSDKGNVSYNNYCAGCKQASFFKKIVLRPAYDMFANFQGTKFVTYVIEEKVEEKKNG